MKTALSFLLVSFLISGSTLAGHSHQLAINTDISHVEWVGEKVAGKHNGGIRIKEGKLVTENHQISSGEITIDMTSITCEDLQGEWGEKLVGHLGSPDFFDIANHPTATFSFSKVKPADEPTAAHSHDVIGQLTIKGITKDLTIPVLIKEEGGKIAASGTAEVDRTAYDIKYGSGKFFDNLGDKMIDDTFTVTFNIAASGGH